MKRFLQILMCLTLIGWGAQALALDIDLDNNGATDTAYGGTNGGTLTDTYLCSYDLAGEDIDCNTDPAGFLTDATFTTKIGAAYDTEAELKALSPITQTASVDNAGALTATAGYKEVDIALTCVSDPSAITVSETGAIANAVIRVTNVAANTCTFAYAASNFEHKGGTGTSLTLETGDSFIAQFQTDRWRVLVNNSSTQYFASLQVPTKTLDPVVGDPDATTFTTAGVNLYGQRFVATAAGAYAHSGVIVSGENWAIESQAAAAVTITVNASDTYWLNGVSCTAGKGLTSDSSVDAFVACQYQAANTVTCRGASFSCTP